VLVGPRWPLVVEPLLALPASCEGHQALVGLCQWVPADIGKEKEKKEKMILKTPLIGRKI